MMYRLSDLKKWITPSGAANDVATALSERSISRPSGEMAMEWLFADCTKGSKLF
ncbi:MAG: hypothetical protein OJF51_005052 [Nitrospira sp.]|jgi:hypothetical protein|nr:MAG: hypothetical protein OJF51_005052 [Nitrospira sp.]